MISLGSRTLTSAWPDAGRPVRGVPHSAESWLFAVALLLSLGLWALSVDRLLAWRIEFGGYWLATAATVFFTAVAVLSGTRWAAFVVCSFLARQRQLSRKRSDPVAFPHVSILVPCFNESATIGPALDSLLELDYPRYEIIVIDDGSTDETLAKARQFEGQFGAVTVRVFHKENGGKWSALNAGFRRSLSELMLCVDADSRLGENSLRRMVFRMEDPRVSVVAGQVRVRNRHNLLTRLQALEYQIGNGSIRMAQDLFGTVLVVPGPIGLFRRSAMEEVLDRYRLEAVELDSPGPFDGNTFAEDFDLSLAILSAGGRTAYEPDAVSHTKAPDRAFSLISQRYRWVRGSMQVLRKFLARRRDDPASMSSRLLVWIWLTYLIDLTVAPVIYILGVVFLLTVATITGSLVPLAAWFAAFLLVQLSAGAFFLSMHRDSFSLLRVLPFYELYCGFLLNSAWVISVLDELRGRHMRW